MHATVKNGRPRRAPTSGSPKRQRGVIAIMVGLMLFMLIGFAGIAIDLGKLYIAKSELANAADSCALAAARDLTKAVSLAASEAAGITAGTRNRVLLQSEDVSLSTDSSVTFSKTFNGTYQTKGQYSAADLPSISYVRCTAQRTGIANWFMGVARAALGSSAVAATAVASTTQAQTTCALPVYICQPPAPATIKPGDWMCSKVGPGSPPPCDKIKGNFGWVDYTGGGANAIKGLLTGSGQCNLPTGPTLNTQTGNIQAAADAWNTRFGIYKGAYKGPSDGASDFAGFAYTPTDWTTNGNAYWGTSSDAYSDFVSKRKLFKAYQGDNSAGLLTTDGNASPPANSDYVNGADRRLAIVPVVDNCSGVAGKSQITVTSWACILMLHPMTSNPIKDPLQGEVILEYLGDASDSNTPCATQGIPGTNTVGIGPKVPVLVQ
ncbi:pilus assembly protein TadG [Pandoraea terrae]|uniref:Pilus assembly protein TadG n=1 Tax=Pandoraea terrae TaxID=1537710 RepID=A0A5E4VHJ0_9BURK|nr:pilus assembly protein TadG-related protein [Pandoraea terrae]VVE11768.1 pilus assembly protein TadG [Pandoraea terrae]